MKPTFAVLTAIVALSLWRASFAEEQTVTFTVEKMTCALCPITVRTAMQRVDGVKSVDVDLGAKTATVVFEASTVTPEQIAEASANAGYPAKKSM